MARRSKTVEISGTRYTIKQLSAVDGCHLLDKYEDSLRAFSLCMAQEVKQITKKHFVHLTPERAFYALVANLIEKGPESFERFFDLFLDGVQVASEPISYNNLESDIGAAVALLSNIMQFNFYNVWTTERYALEEQEEGSRPPAKVQRAADAYSQSHMLYVIQTTETASYNDLSNTLCTEDAFDLYETLCRKHVVEDEARKQAEREAQQNR